MTVRPGTKVTINSYYKVIRPNSVSDLVGKEGIIESHYITEYIVKIGNMRYSVPREAFDIIKTDTLLYVGFKHCPPQGKSNRDVWDMYFEGQRRTVQARDLLNLFELNHEAEEYLTLQPRKVYTQYRDLIEALPNKQKGQEWLAAHPEKANCIYNATSRKRQIMASM